MAREGIVEMILGKRTVKIKAIKVIGLGGIGIPVAQALVQFLSSRRIPRPVWLIDGDTFEDRNRERVLFQTYENKALAKAAELTDVCNRGVNILPIPKHITPANVARLLDDGDVIFMCVDNHATRKLVSKHCGKLKNVVLFSGGNDGVTENTEGTFGNVQIYIRTARRNRTNPLTQFHPEIAHPNDKRPDELGCAAMIQAGAAPQLLFTNLAVASAMLSAFYAWQTGNLDYEELYLDIALGKMVPVRRTVKQCTKVIRMS
jgi:molybdopterin/thiamine biosynthesis adenylyltransferase